MPADLYRCPITGCTWTQTPTDPTPEIGESRRAAARDADRADAAEHRRHLNSHTLDDFIRTIAGLQAAAQHGSDGQHHYLSTACLHGQHDHCRSAVTADGQAKQPGTCKFCPAVCMCLDCEHGTEALIGSAQLHERLTKAANDQTPTCPDSVESLRARLADTNTSSTPPEVL
jgi:hypothetical protein